MHRDRLRQGLIAIALPMMLAACQSDGMSALTPVTSLSGAAVPLSFVAIQGPAADISQKFEGILAQEARRRGFAVVAANAGSNTLQVKTYLDAYLAPDGKAGFSWVMDTSENGRTRSGRVRGAATLGAASGSPWNALDEAAMRQIAQMSIEDLVRQASGAPTSAVTATTNTSQDEAQ
jgi:hypothetical protein